MDRFYLMNVFVAVAEAGSFAGASRKLGFSPPAVTHAISMLEEHLGAGFFREVLCVCGSSAGDSADLLCTWRATMAQ